MKRYTVLLPQPIDPEARDILERNQLNIIDAPDPKPETVAPLMKQANAVVLRTGIQITRELMEQADDLWMISRTGGGVDNVDLDAATDHGIIVTSSLGANTTSVIEHAMAMLLALNKQILLMDREVRNNNFRIRYRNLPRDLRGRVLGILGFGRIGSGLARALHEMFDMKILANDEYLSMEAKSSYQSWVEFTSLEDVLRRSDMVSIHIPLTDETRGIIDRKQIESMKPEAFLVNTSRGGVINEGDLIRALQERKIAGAGLDVFESEPIEPDNPLLTLDNVVLTPHSAALTLECVTRMATSSAERVVALFQGNRPENIANPEVLTRERWGSLK